MGKGGHGISSRSCPKADCGSVVGAASTQLLVGWFGWSVISP
jgi:hypothetical protein